VYSSIACAVIILLIGVSRMYLGVYWPMDVAGGLILGILTYGMFLSMGADQKIRYSTIIAFALTPWRHAS